MSWWFSSLALAVGLFLSSSALTPKECQPLVTPLSLADPSMMFGRTNFIVGYTDHQVYKDILKATDSSWINITSSPSKHNDIVMSQENRINGSCLTSTTNVTIDGNTAKISYANVTSVFHMLPSCDGCLVFSIRSIAKNADKLLKSLNIDTTEEEITSSRETTVKDSVLERFKLQASCLGFSGEPDFHYDPKQDFCREGEGIKMSFT